MGSPTDTGVPSDSPAWHAIDHVQVSIPPGGEDAARAYYAGRLGLIEVPKPAPLAARGGAWFEAGSVRLHAGVDHEFVPARRAHAALTVSHLAALVDAAGLDVTWSGEIPGVARCHTFDPFGNRLELIEAGS